MSVQMLMQVLPQIFAAFLGTVAFALLFGVPRNCYIFCGMIGGLGWLVYLAVCTGADETFAVLLATMAVVFLSRLIAVRMHCPATLFLIPGIFPLVPGAGVYWAAYYVVTERLLLAAHTGYSAAKTSAAIVLGIIFVYEFPQKWFRSLMGMD